MFVAKYENMVVMYGGTKDFFGEKLVVDKIILFFARHYKMGTNTLEMIYNIVHMAASIFYGCYKK